MAAVPIPITAQTINLLPHAEAKTVYDALQFAYPTLIGARPHSGPGSGPSTLVKTLQALVSSNPTLLPVDATAAATMTLGGVALVTYVPHAPPMPPPVAVIPPPVMIPTAALVPPVITPAVITPVVTPAVPLVVAPPTVTPPIVLPPISPGDIAALIANAIQAQSVSQNQLIMDTLKQQGREFDKRMESQFKIITDSLKVAPTPSTSQEVLDELDNLHTKRQLAVRDHGIMTPAQRIQAGIDQHIKGMDAEEARLRDLFIVISNQERRDARASQAATTKASTPKRASGNLPQPATKKLNSGHQSGTTSTIVGSDSDEQASDAEVVSGDGLSLLKDSPASKTKDSSSIRFESSDHMLACVMEVYNKEAAGAPVWGKDSSDLPFRREGKAHHPLLTTLITFAHKAHKLQAKGIRSMITDPEGSKVDILSSQALYEQMIGELLARTARSQIVRELAISLGWDAAENAETLAPPINASTPSNVTVFMSGATGSVLKLATKRSSLSSGQLGKPPTDNSYKSSPPSGRGSGQGSQSGNQHPMCKTCHRRHLPPCRIACTKCTGSRPPLQAGHSGACRT